MKKYLLFLLTGLLTTTLFAQTDITATVYFAKGKNDLSLIATKTLDSLVKALNGKTLPYELKLTGHASIDASSDFNQRLSARRTETVAAYLLQHGIASIKATNALGENQPAEQGDEEMTLAKSRRVVITVHFLPKPPPKKEPVAEIKKPTETIGSADSLRWLLAQLMPKEQFFTIKNDSDTLLFGAKGTQLFVPAYSFDCGNTIRIGLREAYKRSDMFFTNLATNSPEGLLKSDGMIHLEARCEDKIVQPIQPLTVRMPTLKIDGAMKLYSATDGKNWYTSPEAQSRQQWDSDSGRGGGGGRGSDCGDCGGCQDIGNPAIYDAFCKSTWRERNFSTPLIRYFCKEALDYDRQKRYTLCEKNAVITKDASPKMLKKQQEALKRKQETAEVEAVIRKTDKLWRKTPFWKRKPLSTYIFAVDCELQRNVANKQQKEFLRIDSLAKANAPTIGDLDEKQVTFYVFTSANLNWHNIDCLYHLSSPVNLVVQETYDTGKDVRIFYKNARSLVPLSATNKSYYGMNAPGNQPVTIVGLQYKNGAPYLALTTTNTNKKTIAALNYERLPSIMALKEALQKLD